MASNAKIVSSFIVGQCSLVARRGYASTSQGGVTQQALRGDNVVNMMKKGGGDQESNKSAAAWIPDPVTGYYKPEGHENQIDPAELREMLLKHKTQQS
uniref:protein SENESCENCE-ASSOCIATED GENE 21, mitochondrial n=1 Tax=Erigeron canadensis TaxID=72917 RepID=UPI001CB9AC79|nr:protein SENESCENCE-ASSOCIATED GENE 21, mitochondrial [Erigeron canadensis]